MDPFFLKLILGFIVGGTWITLTTVAAERFGSKVGGAIGGLPSTIVVSLFFIAWTQGPEQAFNSTTFMPLAFAVDVVYLIVYAILSRRGLTLGIVGALTAWFALTAVLIWARVANLELALAVWILALVLGFHLAQHRLRLRSQSRVPIRYTPLQIAWRAVFSGLVIAFAIGMSRVGGPVWGGVFSAFPANFTSTLIITSRSVSVDFSRSLVTPLLVSGLFNAVVFGLALRCLIFSFDLIPATALAYGISVISGYLTYLFIKSQVA
jgi:hypothetical protein